VVPLVVVFIAHGVQGVKDVAVGVLAVVAWLVGMVWLDSLEQP
jgi:hypothetical protein